MDNNNCIATSGFMVQESGTAAVIVSADSYHSLVLHHITWLLPSQAVLPHSSWHIVITLGDGPVWLMRKETWLLSTGTGESGKVCQKENS